MTGDDTRLVLHYDFDGDLSAGVVVDRSGSGRHGTLVNPGSAAQTAGVAGMRALRLPGGPPGDTSAAYVVIPHGLFHGLTAATVSVWLNWSGGDDYQWVYCLGRGWDAAAGVSPSFTSLSAVSRAYACVRPFGGASEAGVTATRQLPTGRWVNLVSTMDGQGIRYYLNGVLIGSAAVALDLAATLHSPDSATSGYLGKPLWDGHPYLAGAVADMRVYATAFTDAQVAALAGDGLATLTGVPQRSLELTTTLGKPPDLPTVIGTYSDGIDRPTSVAWRAVEPAAYAERGAFTVAGVVAGTQIAVHADVRAVAPGDLTIDLGTNTGDFHGGASGTLYGLYADGIPSRNLIEGIGLRTVSTKAQDGRQHPGSDALEVVKPLAGTTGGDVYIYMTDIYRGFPYRWPGDTPQARFDDFKARIAEQVDQVLALEPRYRKHLVFVPFNEAEGNMFGNGEWSYNRLSWLIDPRDFFAAWDEVHALIKGRLPQARIAGPNTCHLYEQVKGFLTHTVQAGTVPDVITWHELSDPARLSASVATYRAWEEEIFAGTDHAGQRLPININEYAFNYHTSVPGQMIQWIAAIEESKVDADIAYWNINGNLSDSAVAANRGNGQWWLLHAYAQMSGHTVAVTPARPRVSYTMQGVATVDSAKTQTRALFGGASGRGRVTFRNVTMFGDTVHVLIQEIPWTGQLGDSPPPRVVAAFEQPLAGGTVTVDFGATLPELEESSAYQIILSPKGPATVAPQLLWTGSFEAEDAAHTGTGYTRNGPEGTPSDVSKFHTSGAYHVGGLRTGADLTLDFTVSVPHDGMYDLCVFANSLNTHDMVAELGPTNVFLRVDGAAEQELRLPLGYKWAVWDHTDTRVFLTAGEHVITLATRSLDGTGRTIGDAIVDRITLALLNPAHTHATYEAAHATLNGGARIDYGHGQGGAALGTGQSVTFWAYAADDGEHTLGLHTGDGRTGRAAVTVNGQPVGELDETAEWRVFLSGGINKVTVAGVSGSLRVDRLTVRQTTGTLTPTWYEAEHATLTGTAAITAHTLASGGKAVTGIGGAPGNSNTVTFDVHVPAAGTHALTVRYSNPEQSTASHYNPDPIARPADIRVNGGPPRRVLFPHTFHANNFWLHTIHVELATGHNTIRFSAEELPDFDGTGYISDRHPEPLRSRHAPIIDKIAIAPFAAR